jgi:hypothetical protein
MTVGSVGPELGVNCAAAAPPLTMFQSPWLIPWEATHGASKKGACAWQC